MNNKCCACKRERGTVRVPCLCDCHSTPKQEKKCTKCGGIPSAKEHDCPCECHLKVRWKEKMEASPPPEGEWERLREVSDKIWNAGSKLTHNELDEILHSLLSLERQKLKEEVVGKVEEEEKWVLEVVINKIGQTHQTLEQNRNWRGDKGDFILNPELVDLNVRSLQEDIPALIKTCFSHLKDIIQKR